MKHEEFKKLKKGDNVYVAFIDKLVYCSTGTSMIGADEFQIFEYKKLKVEDVVHFDYDPNGERNGFWCEGLTVTFLKFDISSLSDEEKDNYIKTFRGYFPSMCRGMFDETELYFRENYLEIPDVLNPGDYESETLSLLSKRKKDIERNVKKLNFYNLKRIDWIISNYKKIKKEVREFITEHNKPEDK